MLNRKNFIALALVVVLAACDSGDRKKIAQASDDLARGLSTALALDDALIKQRLISNDDALQITSAILDVNRIARVFNDKAKTYGQSGGSTKTDLLNLANDLSASLASLNSQGVLKIKNPNSQTQFLAAMAVMQSALGVLTAVLQGAK